MADKKSLILNVTAAGGKIQSKAVTNISQTANDFELKTFAQKLNSLTNNTLNSIETVTRADITDAVSPTDPLFTIDPTKLIMATLDDPGADTPLAEGGSVTFQFSYRGEQRAISITGGKKFKTNFVTYKFNQAAKTLTITGPVDSDIPKGSDSFTTTFTLAAGDGYDAATVTLEIVNVALGSAIEDV